MPKEEAKKVAWRLIVKIMLRQEKLLSDYPDLEAYMKEIGFDTEENIDRIQMLQEGLNAYESLNTEKNQLLIL